METVRSRRVDSDRFKEMLRMKFKVEDLSGYAEARAKYDGLIVAAKAAGNELDELRAERDWNVSLNTFRQQAEEKNAQEAALVAARQKAATDFAKAPEVVYASLTTPEAVLAAAQAAHEAIVAAMPPPGPPGQQQRAPGQPWPQPPQGVPGNLQPQHKFDSPEEWNKAMERVKTGPKSGSGDPNNPVLKEMREYVLDNLLKPDRRG
jgi:hypothetical protein